MEEEDDYFRIKYCILKINEDEKSNISNNSTHGIGRIIYYENVQGVYKIRFFYDGQVTISPEGAIKREGIGRHTDTIFHKLAVGYWKQDLPFGKQITYKQKINNAIEIFKEGFFIGDWNKFQRAKILSSFSNSNKVIDWA